MLLSSTISFNLTLQTEISCSYFMSIAHQYKTIQIDIFVYLGLFIANDIIGGFSDTDVKELHVMPRLYQDLDTASYVAPVTITTKTI